VRFSEDTKEGLGDHATSKEEDKSVSSKQSLARDINVERELGELDNIHIVLFKDSRNVKRKEN